MPNVMTFEQEQWPTVALTDGSPICYCTAEGSRTKDNRADLVFVCTTEQELGFDD